MLLEILRTRRRKVGFTLIELLIVIAIILILISIALPNFLEARLRAQVTRARGEINSLRTAFESYAVDFKLYPRGCITDWYGPGQDLCEHGWGFVVKALTTPIKYMSSTPVDLFAVNYSVLGSSGVVSEGHPWAKYRTTKRKRYWEGYPEEQKGKIPTIIKKDSDQWIAYENINPRAYKSKQYLLCSLGPDHDEDVIPAYTFSTGKYKQGDEFYSPTNGTVSGGDLIFVGP